MSEIVYVDSSAFVLLGMTGLSVWAHWPLLVTLALALVTVCETIWRVSILPRKP